MSPRCKDSEVLFRAALDQFSQPVRMSNQPSEPIFSRLPFQTPACACAWLASLPGPINRLSGPSICALRRVPENLMSSFVTGSCASSTALSGRSNGAHPRRVRCSTATTLAHAFCHTFLRKPLHNVHPSELANVIPFR